MHEQNKYVVTYRPLLVKSIIIGWCIGFAIISFFVFGVDKPLAEWGKYWQVRPLLLTPIAGSIGALAFSYLQILANTGLKKVFATIMGAIIFLASIWMGIILGLDGTMWH